MTTASDGVKPWRRLNAATSSLTEARISAANGAPWRSRTPAADAISATIRRAQNERLAGVSRENCLAGRLGKAGGLTEEILDALHRGSRGILVADSRQVDEHIGGRAARRRFSQERRDVEVARRIDIRPPRERLCRGNNREARLEALERDVGRGARGLADGRGSFLCRSGRVLREL